MTTAPRVSVIIAAYNAERYVGPALESLLAQTFADFEVLVIDDGSRDQTRSIAEGFAARDARFRVQTQKHAGVVTALNRGADLARGEYLAWLGADDVAFARRLSCQVEFLDAHPRVVALGGGIVATDAELRPLVPLTFPTHPKQVRHTLARANAIGAPSAMIRAGAYQAVGGCRAAFNDGAEDYDLWLRLSELYDLANVSDLLGSYRVHPGQVSWARVESLLFATVAAQLSARARRTGDGDAYAELRHISYDILVETEHSKDRVDTALLDAAAGQAMFLALLGHHQRALALLDWAVRLTGGSRLGRQALARAALAQSLASWKARRPRAAVIAAARSSVLDPEGGALTVLKGIRLAIWRGRSNWQEWRRAATRR